MLETLMADSQALVGGRSSSGIRKVHCDLHMHDRQKIILITGPILPALISVMADDP
jgi:hypothetical protein